MKVAYGDIKLVSQGKLAEKLQNKILKDLFQHDLS